MRYTLLILICSLFISCRDQKTFLPKVIGASGEVLVVMPDRLWKGQTGEQLRDILSTSYEGLPQEEPFFDVIHINETVLNTAYKQYRNIILVRIGNGVKKSGIMVQRNLWADSQLIISIAAHNDSGYYSLLEENGLKILGAISQSERQRQQALYKSIPDRKNNELISERHQISLIIPKSYRLDMDSLDFTWLTCEYRDIKQGIFIYHYLLDTNITISEDFLTDTRNRFLEKYVSGTTEDSYMTTESRYPLLFDEIKKDSTQSFQIRGLWRMHNGFSMGGPFISNTLIDKSSREIITVEGYVYAPAHKKREYLRQVEAIVLSARLKD